MDRILQMEQSRWEAAETPDVLHDRYHSPLSKDVHMVRLRPARGAEGTCVWPQMVFSLLGGGDTQSYKIQS